MMGMAHLLQFVGIWVTLVETEDIPFLIEDNFDGGDGTFCEINGSISTNMVM